MTFQSAKDDAVDKTIWSSFLGETWDKDKKVGAPFLLILLGFYVFFRPSSAGHPQLYEEY